MTCTSSHLTVRGFLQAYRIAHYELGPRQFWWYWCGGLKVHDAMSVALWLALNILCVQQRSHCYSVSSASLPVTAVLDLVAVCLLWRCPLSALLHVLVAVAVLPVLQEQSCCFACLQTASGSMEGICLDGMQEWPISAREQPHHDPQLQPPYAERILKRPSCVWLLLASPWMQALATACLSSRGLSAR